MAGLTQKQMIGVVLLISLVLLYVPVPFISEKSIAALVILVCAVLLLAKIIK
ncbi:hypothetical protein ACFL0W_06560 [Nanoarchaeota archaeon]